MFMGCNVSCLEELMMSLFGRNSSSNNEARIKLDRKLYVAKESPEPDFDLSDCDLSKVPPGIYSICKVYRKEYLYLHKNKLQALEDGGQLSDLYLIKVLDISSNKFWQLPNDIRYLVNLTELYVQDNALVRVPVTIKYLVNLRTLDVSKNNLKSLTPSLGSLKSLRKLIVTENKDLKELCPELCYALNLKLLMLDHEQFLFPPSEITSQGTMVIMKFLCDKMNVQYHDPSDSDSNSSVQMVEITDPFRHSAITWEAHEAAFKEQENRIHEVSRLQKEKFVSKMLIEQEQLDNQIARLHGTRFIERQKLIQEIQENEKEIDSCIRNFIYCDQLKPEVIKQQLAHEKAEHDRLLQIIRQNYDNVKKSDIMNTMESILNDDFYVLLFKNHNDIFLSDAKDKLMVEEKESFNKLATLLKAKDQSRSELVQQLLEDQDIQKAVVSSLLEQVDARAWSLNQEISLISSHLAKLSIIEQDKKKFQVDYNYNELLLQRTQLINILEDLFAQKNKRKLQLIETLKDMEEENDRSSDFWLRNYQKLIDSAPKALLKAGRHLDPLFANNLLQEGVIHCLPFLVQFLNTYDSILNITDGDLKKSGVTLSSDRENIMKAIKYYVQAKTDNHNNVPVLQEATAPSEEIINEPNCTGVVNKDENENHNKYSECVICMDKSCEVVFVPCGHMCCCVQCGDDSLKLCPMCRATIEKIMKVIIP